MLVDLQFVAACEDGASETGPNKKANLETFVCVSVFVLVQKISTGRITN